MSALPTGAPGRPGAAPRYEVRVGRQAVYDAAYRLVSYQLRFRGAGQEPDATDGGGGEAATSQVIAATFATFGLGAVSDGKPVFINFTRGFLTGMLPIPVEPDNVIIEVTDHVAVDHELLLGLAELRQAGYRLAVDNYRGDPGRSALLELADFVMIDINALAPVVVPGLVASCRPSGGTLVAVHVDDAATLQRCVDLGFELFQGDHLDRPAVLHRTVLSPSQLVCVRLLNELTDPQASVSTVEHLVGSDPGLTIRLLRSAHSARGAGHQIASLRQALVLIGPVQLRSWVVLTLLEGVSTPNASDELWSVLARARACQRLAADTATGDPEVAYTVGLLTGAAHLLGIDAATVADVSGVGDEVRAALVGQDGPAGRVLRAVRAHELRDDEDVRAAGFTPAQVSQTYLQSLADSRQLVHELLGR